MADLHEAAVVAGFGGQGLGAGGALPLLEEALEVLREGCGEGAHGLGERGVEAVADAEAERASWHAHDETGDDEREHDTPSGTHDVVGVARGGA